jgi:UMF1 family MFS transporter
MNSFQKDGKKLIRAWAMYDWANSVYSLTIATAVFPIYYEAVTENDHGNTIALFGRTYVNTALYSYALSAAFLIVAFISPILSSIADFKRNKLSFLKFFCTVGSLACAELFFFDANHVLLGLSLFMLATIGFSGSLVFYNAYLPEVASEHHQDKVSAKGFSYGYVGSVILLVLNLILIQKPGWFGISDVGLATRIAFVMVGLWWIGFAQITFHGIGKFEALHDTYAKPKSNSGNIFGGYKELQNVFSQIKHLPVLRQFLLAFFFYSMGLQTIMYIATLFGSKELHMETSALILTVLIIQLVAIAGAQLFAFLSSRIGNIKTLIIAVVIWMSICLGAYYTYESWQFYVLAFVVGCVMGGIQAISRSTYSKMLPETDDHASYFSFYDVTEKLAIVLGTASYGLIEELTGSMRNSALGMMLFFGTGLLILLNLTRYTLKFWKR